MISFLHKLKCALRVQNLNNFSHLGQRSSLESRKHKRACDSLRQLFEKDEDLEEDLHDTSVQDVCSWPPGMLQILPDI